ncbi:MAG: tRNA lysidine(34) synthetase TilS, partial [Bacteroidota bacterium]|nr:tRNA lysidine(34) synthetase TilS [Bacteroidota bacterium]
MPLLKKFIDNILHEHLFQKNDNLILAVSGGIDSVVLCELCYQAKFNFEIAHCNFQLRGEESERDKAFVNSLGEKYGVKVFIKKFETGKYAEKHKLSIQVSARELRYEWFDELLQVANRRNEESGIVYQILGMDTKASDINIDNLSKRVASSPVPPSGVRGLFLLTAHHANDNAETLLMNFFKGTGIKGLHGILPKQGKIIRPLLFAKREEIVSFANEHNLKFVEDSSNLTEKYTRNYFRHTLIPSVQKVFPQVEENLQDNIERFGEIDLLYQQAIALNKEKLLEYKGNEVHIPVLKLLKATPLKTIIYEIIKEYGFTSHQADEALRLLKSESGKYISSASHRIIKNRKWIIISPHNVVETSIIVIDENDKQIEFANGKLTIEKIENADVKIPTDSNVVVLD